MNINDEYILKNFFTSSGHVNQQRIKRATNEELNYLIHRYNDSFSFRETLVRIKYNINKRPICPVCGNDVVFRGKINGIYSTYCSKKCYKIGMPKNVEQTNLKCYGVKHTSQLNVIKEKTKQTCLEKYGTESPKQSEIVKNKYKQTCLTRYGVENVFQNKEIQYKYKQTCLERYGVENVSQSLKIQNKIKNHNIEKYGVFSTSQLDYVKQKTKQTCLEKYGTTSYTQTAEFKQFLRKNKEQILQHQYETKKKNNSFNKSKQEDKCYDLLKSKFSVVLRQYKSEKYPFSCDFYIPDKELYIEYNGTWTHGKHLFDKANKDDISKLNEWKEKSKKSRYYKNAIYTWTDLDVRKYNIAKQNNLNYYIFYNIYEVKNFLNII